MSRSFFIANCMLSLCFLSCKKEKEKKTSCAATLYGYNAPSSAFVPSSSLLTTVGFGVINPATATSASFASFLAVTYANEGTYNTTDNCYYVFKSSTAAAGFGGSNVLYKIDMTGVVTTLTSSASANYGSPMYNRANNKLYCVEYVGTGQSLVEVVISGSSFSTAGATGFLHPFPGGDNCTVNDVTGEMYFITKNTSTYYLDKFNPGTSTFSSVSTLTAPSYLFGLRYNFNDNMMYAVSYDTPNIFRFIKVNPSSGAITSMAGIGQTNIEFCSACINPCANRYILSSRFANSITNSWDSVAIRQYNMSGTLLQQDTTAGLFNGLTVDY